MANILITGANGGIGRHLVRKLSRQHSVIPISRNPSNGNEVFNPCDLVQGPPRWQAARESHLSESGDLQPERHIDCILHLATTYRVDEDLAMLDHLIEFAKQNNVPRFVYMSSWVVHFPHRWLGAAYIDMKRKCEARVMDSGLPNVQIVRPSVVTGQGLSWTRILRGLAPFTPLIPSRFTRSFVGIDQLADVMERVIDGAITPQVVTVLGDRIPLREKAQEYRSELQSFVWWILIACLAAGSLAVWWRLPNSQQLLALLAVLIGLVLWYSIHWGIPHVLGGISDYLSGFVVRHFEPEHEADVIALCHASNRSVRIRGYDNARLYFQQPHHPRVTTISLKRFNQILDLDRSNRVVRVQAGAHFGQLLNYLASHGWWLENYPNYHFISVGASVATAVHGSNLVHPFLADLIQSFRYYDRDQDRVMEVRREDGSFSDLVFNRDRLGRSVILSVDLGICQQQYYELTSQRVSVDSLRFEEPSPSPEAAEHYEIRVNSPFSKYAYLQSYRQYAAAEAERSRSETEKRLLNIKADAIGEKWNLLQKNTLTSRVTSAVSRLFINYEWFFSPARFPEFWQEIQSDRSRFRLYKVLIRYNRCGSFLRTPYHGTISIDITIPNTRPMLNVSAELFRKHEPLEHLGKYSIADHIRRVSL